MYLLPYLEIKNQAVEDQVLTTATSGLQHAGDGQSQALPTVPINRSKEDSTAAPQPARIPPSEPSRSGLSTQNTFCWPKTQGLSLSLPLRMWRCFNWHWRKFQLSKSPCVLPPKLTVCVGDSGPAPLPGPDSCLLFDCGGTLSLPVWLGGGAGADRADFCGHQVSDHEAYLLMNIIHTSIFPQATFLYTIRVGALCCFTKLLIDGAKSPCIIGKRFHVLKGFWKFCTYQHIDLFAHIPGQCRNVIH